MSATHYGNPITFTPGERAALAMDGDPATVWRWRFSTSRASGSRSSSRISPSTTDRISFLQPQNGVRNCTITGVQLRFDGGDPVDATLDESSLAGEGQTVTFDERTSRT